MSSVMIVYVLLVHRLHLTASSLLFLNILKTYKDKTTSGSWGELLRGRGLPPFRGDDRAHSRTHRLPGRPRVRDRHPYKYNIHDVTAAHMGPEAPEGA